MKKVRRLAALTLTAAMTASMLTACGGGSGTEETTTAGGGGTDRDYDSGRSRRNDGS